MEVHPKMFVFGVDFGAGGVVGPLLFENDVGETITDNGERYSRMDDDRFILAQIGRC